VSAATSLEPSRELSRALIRSLTRGTAIARGARYIHVGHDKWLGAQAELLGEVGEDGHSETKFVRGTYGAGKSHFLSVVQDRARDANWATSHVECKVDEVQIDRFETMYPKIVEKMILPDAVGSLPQGLDESLVDPARSLLDKWSTRLLSRVGVRADGLTRPFDADTRVYNELHRGLLRSNLPAEFTKALTTYVRASLAADHETMDALALWLRGVDQRVRLPEHHIRRPGIGAGARSAGTFDLKPIGRGTARDVMRGVLWLVRAAGYTGLVLCIDEVEELAKLGTRRRQDQALQALREHVDNAGGDTGYRHLCMYLAATPDMFEGEDYFTRYDALATRIQPVGAEVNWRAPVIDLDRTPLQQLELHEMARRIRRVHQIAYGDSTNGLTEAMLDRFVDEVVASRFRIAKPRLLTRMIVDELERARQRGADYRPPADVKSTVGRAADAITKEAAS
jgi:bacteriophage exclusion system BrxC/D-like protein